VEIVDGPRILSKPATHYLGIRADNPFRGTAAIRDKLMTELYAWLDDRSVPRTGPAFFRLHTDPTDVEVGVVTREPLEGDDRVRAGVLPAGRYASLTYVNHARRAYRTLVDWLRDNGIRPDGWMEPAGDHFACRYEAYLTDPRSERMRTRWRVELGILLADDSA
jgi:effector-binding domain-containing protein